MFNATYLKRGTVRRAALFTAFALAGLIAPLAGGQADAALDTTSPDAINWQRQAPIPTGATLYQVDMISATEGWISGDRTPVEPTIGGTTGTILHTTDGGRTWERQNTGIDENINAIRFLDSQHGWAAGSNTTLFTIDGGDTWQRGADIAGSHYFIEPADANNVYITDGYNYYHKSTDGGRTWQTRFMPGIIGSVRFFGTQVGIANGPDGFYRTTDAGANWTFTAGHGGTDWLTPDTGWLVNGNRMERTTDGGQTWQSGELPAGAWLHDASFIDANTGWAVGDSNRIYRTTDGGMTWNIQFGQDPYPYFLPFFAVDFSDALHGVAVGGQPAYNDGILFYTEDGGRTWHDAQNGTGEYTRRIMALDTEHAWAATNNNIVLYTTNGGERWNRSKVHGLSMGNILNDVDFATATTGWVTGKDGLVGKSTDSGRTWNLQQTGVEQFLYGLDAVSEQDVFVVGGGPSYTVAQRSTDGGASWFDFDPGIPDGALYDVFFVDQTNGWIVGSGGGISRTTDGGATWRGQTSVAQYPLAIVDFVDTQNGWAGGTLGELYRTTDGGVTWVQKHAGISGYGHIEGLSVVSANEAWVSGSEVKRTTDGGATWTDHTPVNVEYPDYTSVYFLSPGTGWLGGYAGIYHTADGAPLPTPTSTAASATATSTAVPPTSTPEPSGTVPVPSSTTTVLPSNTPVPPSATPTTCAVSFSDVVLTDYFYEPVRALACAGVVNGYADGTFRPYNNTTRGQLAKIVVLAKDWPIVTPPSTPTFIDVPADHTFYPFVETAYAQGIINGYECGTNCLEFRPGNNITRGQVTKVVVLAAGWEITPPTQPTFGDVPGGHTFFEYVETAFAQEIINGYECGAGCLEFRPGNNATRGQIAKIVYNATTTP